MEMKKIDVSPEIYNKVLELQNDGETMENLLNRLFEEHNERDSDFLESGPFSRGARQI
jgi:predicted CopG family antitoxin